MNIKKKMRIILTKLGNKLVHELSNDVFSQDKTSLNRRKQSDLFAYESPSPVCENKNDMTDTQSRNKISNNSKNNFFLTNTNSNKNEKSQAFNSNNFNHNNKNINNTEKSENSFVANNNYNHKKIEKIDNLENYAAPENRRKQTKSMDFAFAKQPLELYSPKRIHIKQKKLNIPKNIVEKYNNDHKYGYMLPDLNLNILSDAQQSKSTLLENKIFTNEKSSTSKNIYRKIPNKLTNSHINNNESNNDKDNNESNNYNNYYSKNKNYNNDIKYNFKSIAEAKSTKSFTKKKKQFFICI